MDTILDLKNAIANWPDDMLIAAEDTDGNEFAIIGTNAVDDEGVLVITLSAV